MDGVVNDSWRRAEPASRLMDRVVGRPIDFMTATASKPMNSATVFDLLPTVDDLTTQSNKVISTAG